MRVVGSEIIKDYVTQRDKWCLEHYKKHETELTLDEMKILDNTLPCWGETYTRRNDLVEVSMGGTRVRDPKHPDEELHVIYTKLNNTPWYPVFTISKNGIKYMTKVHRLVADAFIVNPDPWNKNQVNHIDGNKWNNAYWNLEWVTPKENIQHAYRTGLAAGVKGEANNLSIYTEEQIIKTCDLLRDHPEWTYEKISQESGVSVGIIGQLYRKIVWPHITTKYKFPPRQTVKIYTDNQVHMTCQLLQDQPDLTYEQIADITGIDWKMVSEISNGTRWKSISKDYDLKPRFNNAIHIGESNGNARYTEKDVHRVCQLLDEGKLSCRKISNVTGVGIGTVKSIKRGLTWIDISKNYNFYKNQTI